MVKEWLRFGRIGYTARLMVMHSNEAYALLDEIQSKYGASKFGRLIQVLLGFAFLGAGYNVPTMQLTGRPDIIASNNLSSYAIEVKTSLTPNIPLKNEDLVGVTGSSSIPVIAALTFPDVPVRWLIVDARKLAPKSYSKTALELYSILELEEIISNQFALELEEYRLYILQGMDVLLQVFRKRQNKRL
jgi:Holliday junction resolvase